METGRYGNTPIHERICHVCFQKNKLLIDDEYHLIMECEQVNAIRNTYIHDYSLWFNSGLLLAHRRGPTLGQHLVSGDCWDVNDVCKFYDENYYHDGGPAVNQDWANISCLLGCE